MSINPESVKQMLTSQDLGDRLRAVNQIRELEDKKQAFELALQGINDPNARVRYSAVSQMDTLGGQDLTASLNVLRDRLLNDPEPDVQAAAADCIGALKFTDAFTDLEQTYYNTSEWLVKFSIIATLGELGDPRSYGLLQQALTSGNDLEKTAAISSFGDLGDPQAVELLLPYTTDADWQIRYRIAQSLAKLGGDKAQSALKTLANDSVEAVAEEAKNGLNQSV